MPKIDELMVNSKKKFKKSEYRPWNYMDEIEDETKNANITINKESIGNQSDIDVIQNDILTPAKKVESQNSAHNGHKSSSTFIAPQSFNKQKKQDYLQNATVEDNDTVLDIIFRLSGHQRVIFSFVIERCTSRGLLTTGAITGETLVALCKTSIKMVKTSIQRLVSKGLLERGKGKTGRGGFYSFIVTELVRNAALDYQRMSNIENHLDIKREPNGNQLVIMQPARLKHNTSSTSLSEEWQNLDFEPLKSIGFSETQLMQLQNKNKPDIVQESIYHFAYGLLHNAKFKSYTDPLNVLMGVLRKGGGWFEKNYQSPQEIAMQQLLEQKKMQQERERALKEEMIKVEFEEWLVTLDVAKKDKILSGFTIPAGFTHTREIAIKAKLFEYYKNQVMQVK